MSSTQTLTHVVDSLSRSYIPPFLRKISLYLKPPHQALRRTISSNGAVNGVYAIESAELETQSVQAEAQPRLWQPPNYQRPRNTNQAYLEVDNVLSVAKKVAGYDGFRFGNVIKKRTKNGSQNVGIFDQNRGMIATTDEDLYSAVVRTMELMNLRRLNYRILGVELKI